MEDRGAGRWELSTRSGKEEERENRRDVFYVHLGVVGDGQGFQAVTTSKEGAD